MKPESMGGLGLPNLPHYFWAAQLRNLVPWILGREESLWVQMEEKLFAPVHLASLIFINHFEKIQKKKNIGEWTKSGIIQFKDLFNRDMELKSFLVERSAYNIPNKDFFKYLQIWSIIHSCIITNKLQSGVYEIED